jgi:hypothetical protein
MVDMQSSKVKDYYYLNVLSEYHKVKDKIQFYENKYGIDFLNFEKSVNSSEKEDFEIWDDYIEWKAFFLSLDKIICDKQDIENGNFRVS